MSNLCLDAMSAILLQPVLKSAANTFVYCDADKRWQQGVTGIRGVKSSDWYDSVNDMLYTAETSTGSQATPGCQSGASVDPRAMAAGQTYCNSRGPCGRCTITLCDIRVNQKFVAVSQLPANNIAQLGSNPQQNQIDQFSLLSTTLLHEVLAPINFLLLALFTDQET